MTQRGRHGMLALVGFILSPLSWWNDLLVNVPLAYALATPFALLHKRLFLPSFIAGYWLTNVVGLVLLHRGTLGLFQPDRSPALRRELLVATLYTLLIVLLVLSGVLPDPESLLSL
jgi:hypothetical protein